MHITVKLRFNSESSVVMYFLIYTIFIMDGNIVNKIGYMLNGIIYKKKNNLKKV